MNLRSVSRLHGLALMLSLGASTTADAAALALGPAGNVALLNPNAIDPASDSFGVATARGDFDADGIDDLAVADRQHPGLVRIYFGTTWTIDNPVANPFQFQTVTVPALPGSSLGPNVALASGDFTRDISDDDELVVGVAGDSLSANNAGAVFVLDRQLNGTWTVADTIRQGADGYSGVSEADDNFGAALAVGRFDQNDLVDLAIGIPGETTSGQADAGAAYIVYQGVGGMMNSNEEVFYRGFNGLTGVVEAGEQLGYALAAGDFNGDDIDDLAVGIPGASCAGFANSGSVMMLVGRNDLDGLDAAGVTYWSQSQVGVLDSCEAGDRFGVALAAGSFDATPIGDPLTQDLAIGIPGEAIDGVTLAGAVAVLHGSTIGITATGDLLIDESQLPGGALAAAAFGSRVAAGRINEGAGSGDSLIIASPLAAQNGLNLAGRLWVLPSSASALGLERASMLSLTPGYVLGPAAASDTFGSQLAIGDFNDDGDNDLAVGVPGDDTTADGSGAVQVIFQSEFIFIDGFDD